MKFELLHALRGLGEKTPEFFRAEAIREGGTEAREAAIHALKTQADPNVVRLAKEMMRIV
jgi:hypothetical protein